MIWKMGVHLIITDSVYAFAWKMKIVQGNHYLYWVDYIFANVVVKMIVKVSYMFP